jgi:hypothetical protein
MFSFRGTGQLVVVSSCLILVTCLILISFFPRYCLSVFAFDDTGEAEFVLFDKVAAGAVGKQVMTLLRQRYPGRSSAEDIAQVARHDTAIPPEINALIGQKFKLLVCISKKWQTGNSEDLSFQVCKVEETYKPELPPLTFPAASGSITASSSASGSGTKLPPLGSPRSALQHTPPAFGHAGYGSPMGQVLLVQLSDIFYVLSNYLVWAP